MFQELQKIVRDLFLLINETNADQASQEVLVKTGEDILALFVQTGGALNVTLKCYKCFIHIFIFSFQWNGRESWWTDFSIGVHWGIYFLIFQNIYLIVYLISGLYGTEEILDYVDVKNYWRVHHRWAYNVKIKVKIVVKCVIVPKKEQSANFVI